MTNIHKIWSKVQKGDTKYTKYYILRLCVGLLLMWCLFSLRSIRDVAQLMCTKPLPTSGWKPTPWIPKSG